jgi:hypothetical protein
MKTPVTLRLEPETLVRLEAIAREERRPLQNLLRNLIADGLDAQQSRQATSSRPAGPGSSPPWRSSAGVAIPGVRRKCATSRR